MGAIKKDLRQLARTHTATAVKTLVGIMRSPKAQGSARIAAANSLLDRGWGKAVQPHAGADGESPIRVENVTVAYVDAEPQPRHTNGEDIQPTNGAAKV